MINLDFKIAIFTVSVNIGLAPLKRAWTFFLVALFESGLK
jgi:hypothetical protein